LPRVAVLVLLLALLTGTATAFALTEVLKLERTPIVRPRFNLSFSPVCDCRREIARLPVKLREAETIDAVIVDGDGDEVRTLATRERHAPGRFVLRWDGTNDEGDRVPDGTYRLRLHFEQDGRTIVIPNPIRVDTERPSIELVSFEPLRFERGGDGAKISVRIDERARPLLFADGRVVLRAPISDSGLVTFTWDGASVTAGRHSIVLRAQDPAGNLSDPTEAVTVRIVRPGQ
jgi:hypothetical protein